MALPLTTITRKVELWLWRLFFVCAIVFMLTWSLAQVLLWGYNHYSKDIEFWLETQSGYDLAFSSSHNQMSGLNPLLSFSDLKVVNTETKEPLAEAKNILIELNTLKSLIYLRPVFDEFVIDALELTVRQREDLSWSLDGISRKTTDLAEKDSLEINRWIDLVLYQGNFDLREAIIHLYHADEPFDRPLKLDVLVTKKGDYTTLEGEVEGDRNPIDLSFRGEAWHLPGEPAFNFDLFIDADDLDSLDWAQNFQLTESYRLDRLAGSMNVWLNWNYRGMNFVAESKVSDLSLLKQDDDKPLDIKTDRFYVSGEFSEAYCSINIPSANVSLNNENYVTSSHRLLCDYLGNWWWTTPEVDVGKLNSMISWLPNSFEKLKKDLSILTPQGLLSYPVLWVNRDGDFRFESDLSELSVESWEGAPGLNQLNGKLVVEESQGYVEFSAMNPTLSYPGIFRNTQDFHSLDGRVDWWLDGENLRVFSHGLSINSEKIDAALGFAFEWEFLSDEARLALDVSISNAQPGQVLEFLPVDLEPELLTWMDSALTQTQLNDGRLLLTLSLDPAAPVTDTLMIDTKASGEQLVYDPAWPAVDNFSGHFEINNKDLIAKVSGVTLGNPIEDLSVIYPDIWQDDASDLNIALHSQSQLKRYLRFIQQSPLDATLGKALQDWTLAGEASVLGGLTFDLNTNDISNVEFEVFPQKASVILPGLPEVSDVQGEIVYTSERDLAVRQLTGQALGGNVSLTLETNSDQYQIKGRGKAKVTSLLEWQTLPESFNEYLEGDVDYYFNSQITENEFSVNVHSSLEGVVSSLPYPMTKNDADKSMIFVYQGRSNPDQVSHSIDVGALNVDYEIRPKTGVERTAVSFGRLPKESRIPDQGTFIFARLSQLDFKAWANVLSGLEREESSEPSSIYADVMIEKASLGELAFDNLSLSCSSSYLGHRVALRSRQASGTIRFPKGDNPIDVDLDYLILPPAELPAESDSKLKDKPKINTAIAKEDPFESLNPADIPATNIKISKLQKGSKELGFWRASLSPVKQGVVLDIKESNFAEINSTGQIWWTFNNGEHSTFLDASIKSRHIDSTFKTLGYEPSFKAKRVNLDVLSYWQGSPAAFDRLTTQGVIDVSVEDGQFLNVSNSASTLKVFGLFNLSSLGRRLKLDFSDVYSSGLAFDEITGRLSINQAIVDIENPIEITGPSANITLGGATNMADETLDMDMRLSVPVSGTLPLAVVVAGVNPLIGGIMLLGQGVWGGVVDQFTGVNYQISGTWDEPVMEATTKVDAPSE
ncbi:YhdP family phospholipid transporter [Litoribrevibacter albus]|uniref:TIGR02099 family protein n=1 Tax=Litoribrevibacter albus TaxID=1473156 RepID=A0AA37SAV0_9GAMM|nr:AsmA-like C-terminal region-containing protein [Litoribrevibacter albus]GLQ31307.1 TIGR02099 family protein [Litoribrevibacter albus]